MDYTIVGAEAKLDGKSAERARQIPEKAIEAVRNRSDSKGADPAADQRPS